MKSQRILNYDSMPKSKENNKNKINNNKVLHIDF